VRNVSGRTSAEVSLKRWDWGGQHSHTLGISSLERMLLNPAVRAEWPKLPSARVLFALCARRLLIPHSRLQRRLDALLAPPAQVANLGLRIGVHLRIQKASEVHHGVLATLIGSAHACVAMMLLEAQRRSSRVQVVLATIYEAAVAHFAMAAVRMNFSLAIQNLNRSTGLQTTGLKDYEGAVVDLLALAACDMLVLSPRSTFGIVAHLMGGGAHNVSLAALQRQNRSLHG